MLQLLHGIAKTLEPIFVPFCFVCAWGLISLLVWSLGSAIRDSVKQAKRMHQIPCARCVFFTSDYHLKCPVQPKIALSEDAIDCPDYRQRSMIYQSSADF